MFKKSMLRYSAIIAVCFLYTGSAYMSQFYRLMEFYDDVTVDAITSGWNYILQAAGIGLFCLGLWKRPRLFGNMRTFAITLASGAVFMVVSQVAQSGAAIVLSGFVFQIHIGLYFGFYLAMFAQNVPMRHAGTCYGVSYAVGSVGTYLLSLIGGGAFLTSKTIAAVYLALAGITAGLALTAENLDAPHASEDKGAANVPWGYLLPVSVFIMMISVIGSGLYFSYPQAQNVNWNLIRAFYAFGLILAGLVADRDRLIGEVCTVASLTYPLIAMALISDGVTSTAAMAGSYAFRGFVSVYFAITFTDIGASDRALLPLAPIGLLLSRVAEAVLSLLLIRWTIPNLALQILLAFLFAALLILFARMHIKTHIPASVSDEQRLVIFSESFGLTARESEIMNYLTDGLTDDEIAERCHVSRSTIRFHISNLLKKTETRSRVEIVRKLKRFELPR